MSITIKKIAQDLHLAVSTVSKALRDSHEISAETKARIFEYVARVDYVPNPYASSLKGRKTGNIAVVVPEVADSFFSDAINGIEEVAQENGYHVMIYLTHEDQKREQSIIHEFRSGRVEGVLISVVGDGNNTRHLHDLAARVPLVFFDRVCEDINTSHIVTNDYESGYNAAIHLIDRGCRKIAFLSMFDDLSIVRYRKEGYMKALQDNGLDLQDCTVVRCTNLEPENFDIIKQLLQRENRPDSILGSIEKITMQAYSVCHALKLNIPADVKVMGFSHLQIASLLNPPITTITQPAFQMGKTAAKVLFKRLVEKDALKDEKIVVPSVLVERTSTEGR